LPTYRNGRVIAMGTLAGQVAIVTGAGQGVGRGIARAVAAEGAKVVVLGRTKSKCGAVASEIRDLGGEAIEVQCDVEHRDQIEASVELVLSTWGRLDLLVNNAQSMVFRSIRKLTDDDMDMMWRSGPMASFRFMQACFEPLRESKGCVVNMGSGSGIMPQAAMAGYGMAKEALRTLSRGAAVEWGRFGIRVNSICPLAESPGADAFNDSTAAADAVTSQVPLGRWGDAEADIGRGVVYLASDAGRFVTGTTLMIDGGFNYLR
jgi:NAD(P)-dependent dehydrogenase (short-subunit alcohol dehydrogenase family)